MDAEDVVRALGLAAHPEGGWFRETWREPAGTAIYYLLAHGEESRRHRVDKTEVWHFYAGAPLRLEVGGEPCVLSGDLAAGHRPQVVVPASVWQSARPLGAWTLVGCNVCPAFDYAGFQLAEQPVGGRVK